MNSEEYTPNSEPFYQPVILSKRGTATEGSSMTSTTPNEIPVKRIMRDDENLQRVLDWIDWFRNEFKYLSDVDTVFLAQQILKKL